MHCKAMAARCALQHPGHTRGSALTVQKRAAHLSATALQRHQSIPPTLRQARQRHKAVVRPLPQPVAVCLGRPPRSINQSGHGRPNELDRPIERPKRLRRRAGGWRLKTRSRCSKRLLLTSSLARTGQTDPSRESPATSGVRFPGGSAPVQTLAKSRRRAKCLRLPATTHLTI